ncbi:MAG TPA: pyridoxamine 5'-phosphate oxidase family protein [Acidimicrobiales bacterium]|jgi:nitroimidazol reductase NimA-like FMN-containing flavoprotein (pyridoxamine 5'-phosphate oxidase superfamily)|nr:pyridoxamine 5'-phosphate oxidase family protein [Acidimicrobiales bacterium]
MPEPATKLDARFSEPNSSATSWSATQQVLEEAELFWITTVRADGRPHVSPLVAVWLDDALYFSTGPTEQKALNLRANSNVALTTGTNNWDGGLDVVVEGPATQVTDDALLARLATAWSAKWDGRWRYEVRGGLFHHPDGGDVVVYAIHPKKVLAFGKGPFTHTTHRF